MPALDDVQVISRTVRRDDRGWLLKVIDGHEPGLPSKEAEVYLAFAVPGQSRGGHYHREATEWFTVVTGEATLDLVDVDTGARRSLHLVASSPATVRVPPGVAHVFRTAPTSHMLLAAYSDRLYDPADTVPYVIPEARE